MLGSQANGPEFRIGNLNIGSMDEGQKQRLGMNGGTKIPACVLGSLWSGKI